MPKLRNYRIFISHAWELNEYHRIKMFLDSIPNFLYSDYSVPYNNALLAKNKSELKAALIRLIRLSQVIVVSAGMEVINREFILFELEIARDLDKPIIGIIPYGRRQIPRAVSNIAWEIVSWRKNSIVNAIRRHAM